MVATHPTTSVDLSSVRHLEPLQLCRIWCFWSFLILRLLRHIGQTLARVGRWSLLLDVPSLECGRLFVGHTWQQQLRSLRHRAELVQQCAATLIYQEFE